jgi:hypothetical protein
MDHFLYAAAGVGLSAACGFRVFVPFLVAGIASQAGVVTLGQPMAWVGSWPAIVLFGTATLVEIGAYFIPWLDNALDVVATPASMVAGTMMSVAFLPDTGINPAFGYTVAAIVGGGTAGTVQASTVMLRGASTATTGGLANPVVSTGELGGSITLSVLALVVPVFAAIVVAALMVWLIIRATRRWRRQPPTREA